MLVDLFWFALWVGTIAGGFWAGKTYGTAAKAYDAAVAKAKELIK